MLACILVSMMWLGEFFQRQNRIEVLVVTQGHWVTLRCAPVGSVVLWQHTHPVTCAIVYTVLEVSCLGSGYDDISVDDLWKIALSSKFGFGSYLTDSPVLGDVDYVGLCQKLVVERKCV